VLRYAALIGIVGPALFVAIVALLHALEPETNDTGAISEYALGDYGLLMNVAFISAGIGFAGFAVALAGELPQTRGARVGEALLLISALGWFLLGAGNIDREGATTTAHGVVHGIGFVLTTPAALAALFVLARVLRRDPHWSSFGRLTLWSAFGALVLFLLAFADVVEALTFRLFAAIVLGWVLLASARLAGLWAVNSPGAKPRRRQSGEPDQLP
jgi:hypothetical protein